MLPVLEYLAVKCKPFKMVREFCSILIIAAYIPPRSNDILGAYRAVAAPHLGVSDHISVELIPAFKPLICRSKPIITTVKVWTEAASSALQDCFEHTDCGVFRKGLDLEAYTSSVLDCVQFCADAV